MSGIGARVLLTCAIQAGVGGCAVLEPSHHSVEAYTPVFASADACDTAQVRQAIDKNPSLLRATEWERATLLHEAVGHNCKELTRYLLERGANPNAVESDGVTPLHLAAERGNMQTVELLLAHGARINPVDSKGWTPFDRATLWRHPDVAGYLSQHGGASHR
jgi:hypothetical protein